MWVALLWAPLNKVLNLQSQKHIPWFNAGTLFLLVGGVMFYCTKCIISICHKMPQKHCPLDPSWWPPVWKPLVVNIPWYDEVLTFLCFSRVLERKARICIPSFCLLSSWAQMFHSPLMFICWKMGLNSGKSSKVNQSHKSKLGSNLFLCCFTRQVAGFVSRLKNIFISRLMPKCLKL